MKKIITFLLSILLLFAFCACSKQEPLPPNANENPKVEDEGDEKEDEKEENEEENEEETEDGIINLLQLDYKIVYDPYELGMEDLAEDFAESIEEECDTELELLEYSYAKKEKYRIFVGKISSASESNKEVKALTDKCGKTVSAFSIKFSDNTLMVSGVKKQDVKRALETLLSYIKNGEFKLKEDFSLTQFFFTDSSGELTLSEEEFKSSAYLAEIRLNSEKFNEFSVENPNYEFKYPSTQNYPSIEVKTLNPAATAEIIMPEADSSTAIIKVKAEDGETLMNYEIDFKYAESAEITSEIVNKDGKNGVITFVFDDGDLRSADIIISKLMKKYPSIRPSFGIITNQLATVEKNGNDFYITPVEYSYYPISESVFSHVNYKHEFWRAAAGVSGVDILSHSHTHTNEGVMADPVFELAASQAILRELCGADSLCYVMPGVGTVTNDLYLKTLDGGTVYIGARSTSRKVNYVNSYNPFRVSAYAVTRHSTKQLEDGNYTTNENSSRELCLAAGVETWKSHIDSAVEGNAWAAFCFHGLVPAGTDTNGKWTVYEEQVDAIFKYADTLSKNGDAWVANFTEASIYYREWKEASLKTTVFADESLRIVLETALDPSVFNMPLTIKVAVPKSWTSASCDGKELEIIQNEDGTQFVYINIAPGESAIITK